MTENLKGNGGGRRGRAGWGGIVLPFGAVALCALTFASCGDSVSITGSIGSRLQNGSRDSGPGGSGDAVVAGAFGTVLEQGKDLPLSLTNYAALADLGSVASSLSAITKISARQTLLVSKDGYSYVISDGDANIQTLVPAGNPVANGLRLTASPDSIWNLTATAVQHGDVDPADRTSVTVQEVYLTEKGPRGQRGLSYHVDGTQIPKVLAVDPRMLMTTSGDHLQVFGLDGRNIVAKEIPLLPEMGGSAALIAGGFFATKDPGGWVATKNKLFVGRPVGTALLWDWFDVNLQLSGQAGDVKGMGLLIQSATYPAVVGSSVVLTDQGIFGNGTKVALGNLQYKAPGASSAPSNTTTQPAIPVATQAPTTPVPMATATPSPVTFAMVQPILTNRCQPCHGPNSARTFRPANVEATVQQMKALIRERVARPVGTAGTMPTAGMNGAYQMAIDAQAPNSERALLLRYLAQ